MKKKEVRLGKEMCFLQNSFIFFKELSVQLEVTIHKILSDRDLVDL